MDIELKITLCDLFITWTVYLVTNTINKYTATTTDDEGGSHIENSHIVVLRASIFNVYLLAWPAHILVREILR